MVHGLQDGSEDAFRRFVERYHRKLLAIAYRFLGDREEAQDCVQDVCLTVVQKVGGFERRCDLWTWVQRIAVNKAISRLRGRREIADASIDEHLPAYDHDGYLVWPLKQDVRSLDELMESEQIGERICAAIDTLPADYRSAVLLRDVLGYSTKECAELLNITPGAAKVRLHRARSILKSVLKPLILERRR